MAAAASEVAALAQLPTSVLEMIPAATAPPGQVSNLEHPYNLNFLNPLFGSIFLLIALIAYGIRMVGKIKLKTLTLDDLTVTIGMLAFITIDVSMMAITHSPLGRHIWDVRVIEFIQYPFAVSSYIYVVITPLALLFVKSSFFLMYLQIFNPFQWFKIANYTGLALLVAFYVGCTIGQFVLVTPRHGPVNAYWALEYSGGETLSVPLSAVGLGFDLFILILPLFALHKTQLPRHRKVAVATLFASGGLACIASALSLAFRIKFNQTQDYLWDLGIQIAGIIELSVGIVCASMPTVVKCYRLNQDKFSSTRSRLLSYLGLSSRSKSGSQPQGDTDVESRSALPKTSKASDGDSGRNQAYSSDGEIPYELGQMQSVRTMIATGAPNHEMSENDDRIHVRKELQQNNRFGR